LADIWLKPDRRNDRPVEKSIALTYGITYANNSSFFQGCLMNTLSATEARSKLYRLIDETAASHQPVLITGQRTNAILVSEEDWNAIQGDFGG